MLSAPNGFGVVTALTATPGGFTAAGVVGQQRLGQHAVTWTSPDGATWSTPTDAPGDEITALAATTFATGATAPAPPSRHRRGGHRPRPRPPARPLASRDDEASRPHG